MMDFAQWLSASLGTGQLASDATIAAATIAIIFLSIALLARISLGTDLEDLAGDDSCGMHDSLDRIQLELLTVSQLLLYRIEQSGLKVLHLRADAASAAQDGSSEASWHEAA